MPNDALQRLYEDSLNSSGQNFSSTYSMEEEIEDEDDNFIDMMSQKSKEALFSKVPQPVSLEEDENEIEEQEPVQEEDEDEQLQEEPVEIEQKRGRGRPRKEETTYVKPQPQKPISNKFEFFMDSLAKDLIEELKESNYRTRNFNKEQMMVILNYLEEKI